MSDIVVGIERLEPLLSIGLYIEIDTEGRIVDR